MRIFVTGGAGFIGFDVVEAFALLQCTESSPPDWEQLDLRCDRDLRELCIDPSKAEPAVKLGRKLVAARFLPAGHVSASRDVAVRPPGDGLPPYELERLVGRRLCQAVAEETPLALEMLEEPAGTQQPALGSADAA